MLNRGYIFYWLKKNRRRVAHCIPEVSEYEWKNEVDVNSMLLYYLLILVRVTVVLGVGVRW